MKKSLIALLLTAILALTASGCGKKGISTEMTAQNITSMAIDGQGTVYLLSDTGLRSYKLSGDKNVEYVFDSDDLAEAEFKLINKDGETITYSAFTPERIISNGETGLQFLGYYRANDLSHDNDLFVVQDIADMNFTAAYYGDISRDYAAKTPVVNGVGVTDTGIYFKLNRQNLEIAALDDGVHFWYDGLTTAYDVPDNLIGAFDIGEDDEEQVYFLIGNGNKATVVSGDETLAEFSGIANAFADVDSIYVIYKNGKITNWTPEAGEKDFADLKTKLTEVKDPFIWDGTIYWFDKEGVKRAN